MTALLETKGIESVAPRVTAQDLEAVDFLARAALQNDRNRDHTAFLRRQHAAGVFALEAISYQLLEVNGDLLTYEPFKIVSELTKEES